MAFKTVKENQDYMKDTVTGQIVNKNSSAYNARLRKIQREKVRDTEVSSLKSELAEMKALVQQLIDKEG